MKIILLQDLKGVGKRYDIKEVSRGYAVNFLIPRNLAKPATSENLKQLESIKKNIEAKTDELLKNLNRLAELINERHLEFRLKTDEKGIVFGSINKDAILKAMREHNLINKERVEIKLERPIKKIGEYKIPVNLKKGITAELKIIVLPQK